MLLWKPVFVHGKGLLLQVVMVANTVCELQSGAHLAAGVEQRVQPGVSRGFGGESGVQGGSARADDNNEDMALPQRPLAQLRGSRKHLEVSCHL